MHEVVAATPTGDRITELTLEGGVNVSLDNNLKKWYKFTPKETGTYQIYSTGLEDDIWFKVYSDKKYENSDYHYLTFSDIGQAYKNGDQVTCPSTLDEGTNYYISLCLMRDNTQDDFVLGVEKVE